ncbi:unnamed protein product [Oppiella nova]|uniref:Uncharacterized protein n=1 Tax=Oppiella nova TaxID=334625 RepID=A0A7R9MLW0_9ACAR|nr:unnamed protein product [Oppiella nova]CAG2179607.1 unnamed protein product [Oppiella nova]
MSVSWDELNPDIRLLESKVSLIFTNFVLHYIQNKTKLLHIFSRLLSTEGSIHANIIILPDLNKKLSPDDRKDYYLSVDQQIQQWKEALDANGLTAQEFEIVDDVWHQSRQEIIDFLQVLIHDFRPFFASGDQFEAQSKHMSDIVFDAYVNPGIDEPNPNAWKKFMANDTITRVVLHFKILRLIANK